MRIADLKRVRLLAMASCAASLIVPCATPALADRIDNQVAVFSALDKVTARISKFEVALGETATFGALKVTPRACYSRPSTEQPKTTTFVEVDEVQLDGQQKRIFTGWMFAESPGLYGVEHPTFDVWLTDCNKPLKTTAEKAPGAKPARSDRATSEKTTGDAGAGAGDDTTGAAAAGVNDAYDPNAEAPLEPRRRVRR